MVLGIYNKIIGNSSAVCVQKTLGKQCVYT